MSYAKLEEKIRRDAVQDLSRRLGLLEQQMQEAAFAQPELSRELHYLERMAAAAPEGFAAQVQQLRRAFDKLEKAEAGSFASVPSVRSQAADSGYVGPVASFLRPEHSPEEGEDEVRVLSAEGRLAEEFQRFPVLSVAGTESLLVFRKVRSWRPEDDEEGERRERLAVLELTQAAVNLRQVQDLVQEQVAQDQARFDAVVKAVGEARRDTAEAVVTLKSARTDTERLLAWLAPSIGLVIIGGGIISVAPAAAAGCVACVVVRSGVTMGVLGFHVLGSYSIKKWQERVLQAMTEQLPLAFDGLPECETKMLRKAGDEAQRRLLAKLDDRGSWSTFHGSVAAVFKKLQVMCRASDVRKGGYAFSTSFRVKRCTARRAFSVIRQLSMSGSMDPNCEVVWSRPVASESEEGETSLRYLVFSNVVFGGRDFYCVCRCAQEQQGALTFLEASPGAEDREREVPPERFCFAVTSLMPEMEMVASSGLPESNKGLEHGTIHCSGIRLADDGLGGVAVEVMADVDCSIGWLVQTWASDNSVRLHVLETADRLRRKLKKQRPPKGQTPPATGEA